MKDYNFTELNEMLDSFLEAGTPGIDCIVYKDGEEVFRRFDGFSDYEKKTPVNGKERYNIYSCSKPITCTAAMQLYEKGLFKLDDPLYEYLPEFRKMYVKSENGDIAPAKNAITIEHLFTMTAGLTYDLATEKLLLARKETDSRCPTRETMKYLARDPLAFEPGTKYNYSLCHDVIAALVEVVSGESFAEYVKKNIFEPLGMKNSSFLIPDSELDSICAQYRYNNETKVYENYGKKNNFKLGSEYASGGAGCISTVDDYIKFLEAMRKGSVILKAETTDLMTRNHLNRECLETYTICDNILSECVKSYGYGLGLRCPLDESSPESDFGWGGAAGAYLAADRKYGFTLFYAQQVLNSPIQSIRSNLRKPVRKAFGV